MPSEHHLGTVKSESGAPRIEFRWEGPFGLIEKPLPLPSGGASVSRESASVYEEGSRPADCDHVIGTGEANRGDVAYRRLARRGPGLGEDAVDPPNMGEEAVSAPRQPYASGAAAS